MRLSASALNEGGNSLDESIAMITAANEVVNDPSSVGTALKTLTLRLRGSKTELEEMGEDVSDMATTTSQLQAKLLALTGGKVDIMLDEKTFKSSTQILREMAKAFKDMDDISRASALELMGGKRQANILSALITNFDTVEAAIEASANSSGSALRENERYLDSINGKIDQFNNAVQAMWSNELESDFIKDIVTFGTEIIKVIDSLGLLGSAFVAFGAFKGGKGLLHLLSSMGITVDSLTSKITSYAFGLDMSTVATTKLTQAQLTEKLMTVGMTEENAKAIVVSTGLGVSTDQLTKETLEAAMAKKGYSEAIINETSSQIFANSVTQQATLTDRLANTQMVKTLATRHLVRKAIKANGTANMESIAADVAKMTSNKLLSASFKELAASAWSAIQSIAPLAAAVIVVVGVTHVVDALTHTTEELEEKYNELNNTLSETESKLNTLKSDLSDINNRIKEINAQDSLSFTDQEELDRLKTQSAELERQVELNETLKKQQQIKVNESALSMANNYEDVGTTTGKTTDELSATGGKYGAVAGGIVGGIALGGKIGAAVGTLIPIPVVGNIIGLAAGALVGAAVGAAIGAAGGAVVGESEGKIGDSLDNIKEQHDELLEDFNSARDKYQKDPSKKNKEKFEEAQKALQDYEATTAEYLYTMDSYYSQMDWESATTEQRKAMQEFYDTQDKWAIQSGAENAKSNAIARIFGDEAQGNIAKARDEINKLKKNLAEAKQSGKGVDEALAELEEFELNLSEEEVNRLREMGIYLHEVEDYFKNVVKTESEFVDSGLEDVARDINKITDGLDSLKSAFDEVVEDGVLTAKTILSIKEALDIGTDDTKELTAAWDEYLKVMMSGTSTTEEMTDATERLTKAWIEDALANNNLTTDNKAEYIAQLRSLGVANAAEYVDDLLQKNMVADLEDDVSNAYTNALKKAFDKETNYQIPTEKFDELFANLDEGQLAELAEEYNVVGSISSDAIDELADKYGVTAEKVQEIIDKLNQKQKLENDLSAIEAEQEAYDEFSKSWRSKLQDYKKLEKDIVGVYNSFTEAEKNFNELRWYRSGGGYQNHDTGQFITESEYNELRSRNKEYQKLINSDTYAEYKKLHDELIALQNSEEGKKWLNDDLTLKVGVDAKFEDDYNKVKGAIAALEDQIDDELTANVQLQLDLQNKSELVDEIQDVFDALVNAQKEYEQTGYISVDTLQTLLQLEPKYLDLLVDESGNLNLTKDALYNVARARITDMGIQSQKNILEKASALASEGSSNALREQIEVMQNANDVGADFVEVEMAKIRAILAEKVAAGELTQTEADAFVKGTMNQIEAVQVATQSALNNLNNSLSSSGNTANQETEDKFQELMDYYDNRISANQAKYDQIQNDIDYLEAQGKSADAEYYKDQLALLTEGEESKEELLEAKLKAAADRLRELESAGKKGSEEWWQAAEVYNSTLSELDEVRDTVLDLQDSIGNLKWDAFEEFNSRLDDITKKLKTIRDLLAPNGADDWFDDEGNWTEKGVAVLGSEIQELHTAQADLNKANSNLSDFGITQNEDGTWSERGYAGNEKFYADEYGIHSEQEYYDAREKLLDEQYDAAVAVSDKEQDIADMYESQIDAVEEYYQTLVDGYNDYIDNVKEALDAEKELYNFKKNVKKQAKDIASLERRIAALSGSTNAADIAERRKLEAQLADQREELNDTYYEHSVDSQQNALDEEARAYEQAMNRFVEGLRDNLDLALKDMDGFIAGVTAAVTANAPTILGAYNSLGIALDSSIVDPWQSAIDAMGPNGYSGEKGLGLMNSWVAEGGVFDTFATNATSYLTSIWSDSNVDPNNAFYNAVTGVVSGITDSIRQNVETAKGYLTDLYDVKDTSNVAPPGGNGGGGGGGGGGSAYNANVAALQDVLNTVFNLNLDVDGKMGSETTKALKRVQKKIGVTADGKYGSDTRNAIIQYIDKQLAGWKSLSGSSVIGQGVKAFTTAKKKLPTQLAKGTLGTSYDQFAITDESWIGEEITLAAGKNGQLQYLKKGSAVMPADISANLIEWGKLNPNMLNVGTTPNVNMISNAINKPEFNFNVDNFLRCDNVSQDTLPELKQFVKTEMNNLIKQMNYAIKGKGGR